MNNQERAAQIARYREGPGVLEQALEGITPEELDRRPAPDQWSPREVVHHTADSETMAAVRLRRLLAEESPVIQGYDEMEFSRRLHYADRPLPPSLAAVRAARETSADILDRLTQSEWARAGTHTESGPYSVGDWLRIYAAHCHDHAEQIRRARAGSP
jgi:hypothetical protein